MPGGIYNRKVSSLYKWLPKLNLVFNYFRAHLQSVSKADRQAELTTTSAGPGKGFEPGWKLPCYPPNWMPPKAPCLLSTPLCLWLCLHFCLWVYILNAMSTWSAIMCGSMWARVCAPVCVWVYACVTVSWLVFILLQVHLTEHPASKPVATKWISSSRL